MIHMDAVLLEFIQYNWITLGVVFGVLAAFAKTYNMEKLAALIESIKGSVLTLKKKK